jgi:hypothetical protein
MIGRASIGNPWFFNQVKHFMKTGEHLEKPTITQRIDVAREHLLMSVEWKGEKLGILEMRRHYTNYFKGIPDFKPHRMKLVTMDSLADLLEELENIDSLFSSISYTS